MSLLTRPQQRDALYPRDDTRNRIETSKVVNDVKGVARRGEEEENKGGGDPEARLCLSSNQAQSLTPGSFDGSNVAGARYTNKLHTVPRLYSYVCACIRTHIRGIETCGGDGCDGSWTGSPANQG